MAGNEKLANARRRRLKKSRAEWTRLAISSLLISMVTVVGCLSSPVGRWADQRIMSALFATRGTRPVPNDVVIAALDDESYTALHVPPRLPFPRKYAAAVFEKIMLAHPRVVIMDLEFSEETSDPEADERIVNAIGSGPVTIFSGLTISGFKSSSSKGDGTYMMPLDPKIAKAAKMLLPMTLLSEFNNTTRLAAVPQAGASVDDRFPIRRALQELGRYKVEAPGANDLINFYGASGTLQHVPYYRIIQGEQEEVNNRFKDKVVLVGYQSTSANRIESKDSFPVTVSPPPMFGVEIHATIAGNLIEHSWLHRLSPEKERELLTILSLAAAVVGLNLSLRGACIFAAAIGTGAVAATYFLFTRVNVWVPYVMPLVCCSVLTVAGNQTLRYFWTVRRHRATDKLLDFDVDDE